MKRIYVIPFVLVLLTIILGFYSFVEQSPKKSAGNEAAVQSVPTCSCGSLKIQFSSTVPGDAFSFGNQTNADCFAWAEFVSLNWPQGSASYFGDPADMGPVQWETYMAKEELFTADGSPPPPWGTLVEPEEARKLRASHFNSNTKLLMFVDKFETESARFDSTSTGQAFPFNSPSWLGAQNNTNVWYEVRLNKDIYDYVTKDGYYNAQNQLDSVSKGIPILFPKGVYNGVTGAIELKAAWMEVKDSTNVKWKRYKISRAVVIDANTGKFRNVIVALVGLHVLHKTTKQPSWVWATFEQIDNVPGSPGTDGVYNFNNGACVSQSINVPTKYLAPGGSSPVTVSCTPNTSPGYYLGQGGPGPVAIQATRLYAIDPTAAIVNNNMQDTISRLYPNSVWKYYELVDVIWSTNPRQDPRDTVSAPVILNGMQPLTPVANTTMETYIQTATCTACHTHATIAPTLSNPKPTIFADFSFAIGSAGYPVPKKHKLKFVKKNIPHVPYN
jgi:hypothetical protein